MSILDHTPAFSIEDATHFAQKFYTLQVEAKPLPSERDQNFLLQVDNGNQFVLKIANATEERAMLEAQNQVMRHLENYVQFCPRVIPAVSGEETISVNSASGEQHFLRLLTYLKGMPLGNVKRHSIGLLQDLGFKMGQVTEALRSFDHPALHRDFHWDLANGLGIIHNDANNFNLLAGGGDDIYSRDQNIVGLIDFGDMVYSYAISDLAVAIAYAILDKPDPLAVAAQIVKGYHAACPITKDELAALFELVAMRLCMSACIDADQQSRQP